MTDGRFQALIEYLMLDKFPVPVEKLDRLRAAVYDPIQLCYLSDHRVLSFFTYFEASDNQRLTDEAITFLSTVTAASGFTTHSTTPFMITIDAASVALSK